MADELFVWIISVMCLTIILCKDIMIATGFFDK